MVIVRETLMPRDKKLQRNEILKIYKERGVSYVKEEV